MFWTVWIIKKCYFASFLFNRKEREEEKTQRAQRKKITIQNEPTE
jgi:uncharacterized protein (DUF2225 family)